MQLGALFSGGKDSLYSIYNVMRSGHEVKCLITIVSKNPESYMYHVPNIELTKLQAQAMGIPIISNTTEGEKEIELDDLTTAINEAKERYHITGLVNGAIYSNYQRKRIDKICSSLDLTNFTPLWKLQPKTMLSEMVDAGFTIIISAVAADGLGPDWLGRELDHKAIDELSKLHETCYVCTGGEGGEFETLVTDSPLFKKRIRVIDSEITWDGMAGIYKIKKAKLIKKLLCKRNDNIHN